MPWWKEVLCCFVAGAGEVLEGDEDATNLVTQNSKEQGDYLCIRAGVRAIVIDQTRRDVRARSTSQPCAASK